MIDPSHPETGDGTTQMALPGDPTFDLKQSVIQPTKEYKDEQRKEQGPPASHPDRGNNQVGHETEDQGAGSDVGGDLTSN